MFLESTDSLRLERFCWNAFTSRPNHALQKDSICKCTHAQTLFYNIHSLPAVHRLIHNHILSKLRLHFFLHLCRTCLNQKVSSDLCCHVCFLVHTICRNKEGNKDNLNLSALAPVLLQHCSKPLVLVNLHYCKYLHAQNCVNVCVKTHNQLCCKIRVIMTQYISIIHGLIKQFSQKYERCGIIYITFIHYEDH